MLKKGVLLIFVITTLTNCQQAIVGSSGYFYSPNYPGNYDNNMNYQYNITVPAGRYIHLTFLDFLSEDPYDFLNIMQGIGADATLTGDQTGVVVNIQSNEATLIFKSDLTTTFRGFAIEYDSVMVGNVYVPSNIDCNVVYNTSFGLITTPNFPDNYPDNYECKYMIEAPVNHVITLLFVAFTTEDGYDIVYVYDGSDETAPLNGKYSGTKMPPTITSTSNNLYIKFTSDLVNNFQGFSALYTSVSLNDARRGVLPQDTITKGPLDTNIMKWLKDKKDILRKKEKKTTK